MLMSMFAKKQLSQHDDFYVALINSHAHSLTHSSRSIRDVNAELFALLVRMSRVCEACLTQTRRLFAAAKAIMGAYATSNGHEDRIFWYVYRTGMVRFFLHLFY